MQLLQVLLLLLLGLVVVGVGEVGLEEGHTLAGFVIVQGRLEEMLGQTRNHVRRQYADQGRGSGPGGHHFRVPVATRAAAGAAQIDMWLLLLLLLLLVLLQ